MEITREAAVNLINNYCQDEPENEQAAIDAIMAIPASDLKERSSNNWVEVANGMGMDQDSLDAIIYSA